jgi:hypothetical protein
MTMDDIYVVLRSTQFTGRFNATLVSSPVLEHEGF